MATDRGRPLSAYERQPLHDALASITRAAASNIPGVDLASISVRRKDQSLDTVAATSQLAHEVDALQYELREGPCYSAVTDERFVVVNDLSSGDPYPHFGPRAVELGLRSQAAVQLERNGDQAGLNLYSRDVGVFDQSTVHMAELFSAQAASLLGYARQVGTLTQAVTTRQEIGTAVGILMERYGLDAQRAFDVLVRISNDANTKLHVIAERVIDGSFDPQMVPPSP
jgi:hypothetical protein